MTVAIVGGTGDLGFALAVRLAEAGVEVVIGSRDAGRAEEAAGRAEVAAGASGIRGAENPEAVSEADVVFVTVPYAGQAEIYRSIRDQISAEEVVCDTTTPLATAVGGRPTDILRPWHGSAAEQAAAVLRDGTALVSGFHTVSAEVLEQVGAEVDEDVLLCGDDGEAKARIGELVERVPGLRWVDCGALSTARILEPITAALISVNRKYGIRGAGIRLTGAARWGRPER
jgi:8-hydroxy-5-deazaflavin:NADPH oxidoreductase